MSDEKSYLKQLDSGSTNKEQALKDAELAVEEIKKTLKWELDGFELQRKLYELVKGKNALVKPEFVYQQDDEYWRVQEKVMAINFEKQEFEHQKKVYQIEKTLKIREDSLKELKGDEE